MKTYDLTATLIDAMETPWIYTNDNLTPNEKQQAYDDSYEWFFEVAQVLETKRRSAYPNVVYLEDYI